MTEIAAPTLAEIETVFFALAHAARRHLVQLLAHAGGELPSGYLAKRLSHSWPTTTRHLHVLEDAGIVVVRRAGRGSFYRLDAGRVGRVLGHWLAGLEPPTPHKTWAPTGPRSLKDLRKQKDKP